MNEQTPQLATAEEIEHRSGYQSMQPVRKPSYWGVDLDWSRRPGVPSHRDPQPFANARIPPERQQGVPSVQLHGRSNKQMTPVFSTAVPLRGASGAIRRLAYRLPDHKPAHWFLKLLGDRVDSWSYRARKVAPIAISVGAGTLIVRALSRD